MKRAAVTSPPYRHCLRRPAPAPPARPSPTRGSARRAQTADAPGTQIAMPISHSLAAGGSSVFSLLARSDTDRLGLHVIDPIQTD